MLKVSKRRQQASEIVKDELFYSLDEALSLLKEYAAKCKVKFDETVEIIFKLGIDPKHSDQMLRGVVAMPNGLGKQVRVAVFTSADRIDAAKKAGADVYGAEELVEEVKAGKLDFDICIATPDMMGKVGMLGKVLGPKGMMPNPKLGTVTNDIEQAVQQAKSGQVEYKSEKSGLVHAGIGKLSFELEALKENILAIYNAVLTNKPSGAKGTYMQKIYLSTSMGPSIKLDLEKVIG